MTKSPLGGDNLKWYVGTPSPLTAFCWVPRSSSRVKPAPDAPPVEPHSGVRRLSHDPLSLKRSAGIADCITVVNL